MRLFIAFPLPEGIKQYLGRMIENMRRLELNANWVKPQNMHITVKFLGETGAQCAPGTSICAYSGATSRSRYPPPQAAGIIANGINTERIKEIETCLAKTIRNFSPLTVKLENYGFFPDERKPRVFFVSTDNEKGLESIADDIEMKLENAGFNRENRFKSHITLARIKNSVHANSIADVKRLKPEAEFVLEKIALFKSVLSAQGPYYETISQFPFSGNNLETVSGEK